MADNRRGSRTVTAQTRGERTNVYDDREDNGGRGPRGGSRSVTSGRDGEVYVHDSTRDGGNSGRKE